MSIRYPVSGFFKCEYPVSGIRYPPFLSVSIRYPVSGCVLLIIIYVRVYLMFSSFRRSGFRPAPRLFISAGRGFVVQYSHGASQIASPRPAQRAVAYRSTNRSILAIVTADEVSKNSSTVSLRWFRYRFAGVRLHSVALEFVGS